MAQRVTLAVPDPANPGQDMNVGTAASPLITSAASTAPGTFSATKQEDTPSADGHYGSASLWVRRDANVARTSADGDYINPSTDTYGNNKTVQTPSDQAGAALVPSATAAVAGSLILKASAGNLYGYNVVAGASAGYVMIFNSATVPADGAVTPLRCIPLAANAGIDRSFDIPRRFSTGITIVFSTTGPFTKTASATAFIAGEFQ